MDIAEGKAEAGGVTTVVALGNIALRSDKAEADPVAMLFLGEHINDALEANRDKLAEHLTNAVVFGRSVAIFDSDGNISEVHVW